MSETDHTDLFWAIRGGGGNFGIVTQFEFALLQVGPIVQLGLFLFHPDQGGELFRFARDFVRDLPDDCVAFLAGLSAPPQPFVPQEPASARSSVCLSSAWATRPLISA